MQRDTAGAGRAPHSPLQRYLTQALAPVLPTPHRTPSPLFYATLPMSRYQAKRSPRRYQADTDPSCTALVPPGRSACSRHASSGALCRRVIGCAYAYSLRPPMRCADTVRVPENGHRFGAERVTGAPNTTRASSRRSYITRGDRHRWSRVPSALCSSRSSRLPSLPLPLCLRCAFEEAYCCGPSSIALHT